MTKPHESAGRKFTYEEYLTWPAEERWEIHEGEAIDMTPSPAIEHQEIIVELGAQFRVFLRGKPCRVIFDFDVILPTQREEDEQVTTVVRPDLIVVCDSEKLDGKRVRGAPDLIVEVLSPRTASYDCIRKRRFYEADGVKEFWLVHPSERIITVFHAGKGKSFGSPQYYDGTGKIAVSVLPGLEIDLSLVFPPPPKVVKESPKPFPMKNPGGTLARKARKKTAGAIRR